MTPEAGGRKRGGGEEGPKRLQGRKVTSLGGKAGRRELTEPLSGWESTWLADLVLGTLHIWPSLISDKPGVHCSSHIETCARRSGVISLRPHSLGTHFPLLIWGSPPKLHQTCEGLGGNWHYLELEVNQEGRR